MSMTDQELFQEKLGLAHARDLDDAVSIMEWALEQKADGAHPECLEEIDVECLKTRLATRAKAIRELMP